MRVKSQNMDQTNNMPEKLVDWDYAAKLLDGDKELLQVSIDAFSQSAQENWQELQKAWQEQDAEKVRRLAHNIKSSLRSLGAFKSAELASGLEQAGQGESLLDHEQDLINLEEHIKKILSEIDTYNLL